MILFLLKIENKYNKNAIQERIDNCAFLSNNRARFSEEGLRLKSG